MVGHQLDTTKDVPVSTVTATRGASIAQQVETMLEQAPRITDEIPRAVFDTVVGKLGFVGFASRFGGLLVAPWTKLGYDNGARLASVRIPETLRGEALNVICPALRNGKTNPWFQLSAVDAAPTEMLYSFRQIIVTSDASGYGIGMRLAFKSAQRAATEEEAADIIAVAELRGMVVGVQEAAVEAHLQTGRHQRPGLIISQTDNDLAARWVNKGRAHHPEARALLIQLAATCMTANIHVKGVYVTGAGVIALGADELSRGDVETASRLDPPDADGTAVAVLRSAFKDMSFLNKELIERYDPWRSRDHWKRVMRMNNMVTSSAARTAWTAACTACGLKCMKREGVWCRVCCRVWHRQQCAGDLPAEFEHSTFTCGMCVGKHLGAPTGVALDGFAAVLACDVAASTSRTRDGDLSRFAKSIEGFVEGCEAGEQPERADWCPSEAEGCTPAWAVALFLQQAMQKNEQGELPWAVGTVRNTLTAVSRAHTMLGLGDEDPLGHPWIVRARKALGRMARGTKAGTPRPAWAVPVEHVALLVAAAVSERDRFIAENDVERATAASRDALWYALAFMACLRKSEINTLTRLMVRRLGVAGLEVLVPWAKNNQDGASLELTRVVIAAIERCTGMNVGDLLRTHEALLDVSGVPADGPLFGHQKNPHQMLSRDSTTIMERLHRASGDRSKHRPYYDVLRQAGCRASEGLSMRTHSFRRGGICYIRDALRARRAHHWDMVHTLLQHGRWKNIASLRTYLVLDDAHFLGLQDDDGGDDAEGGAPDNRHGTGTATEPVRSQAVRHEEPPPLPMTRPEPERSERATTTRIGEPPPPPPPTTGPGMTPGPSGRIEKRTVTCSLCQAAGRDGRGHNRRGCPHK